MEDQEEQLVQQGEAAEMLLDSDAFSSTINQLVDASFQTFSNTAPLETEKRETAYHHYRTCGHRLDATSARPSERRNRQQVRR